MGHRDRGDGSIRTLLLVELLAQVVGLCRAALVDALLLVVRGLFGELTFLPRELSLPLAQPLSVVLVRMRHDLS